MTQIDLIELEDRPAVAWSDQPYPSEQAGMGGPVYALIADLPMASKIAQVAQHCRLVVRNFDHVDKLMGACREKPPKLVLLDWEGREAEAYKVLKELSANADLKGVATIGFVTQSKRATQDEAQRAGCMRVYPKTEFLKLLEDILMRYGL